MKPIRSWSPAVWRGLAALGVLAVVACEEERLLHPTDPPGYPELAGIALQVTVDVKNGEVRVASAEPATPQGLGRAYAILGTNEVALTSSNFARSAPVNNKVTITFDVAIRSRLTSASLVPPTFPPSTVGATGLLLFPMAVTQVVGGTPSQVVASADWNGDGTPGSGAPRNFFNDYNCPASSTSDCFRWEQYPAPLGPGVTTPAQKVGFVVPKAVQSFQAWLILAADISNDLPAVARIAVTPPSYVMNDGFPAGFSAVAYDQLNNPLTWATITWTSADPTAVQFQNGSALVGVIGGPSVIAHGRKVGQTSFTASSGGVSVVVPLDIQVNTVALVQLYTTDSSITVGDQLQGDARVKDHSGQIIPGLLPSWSTSDPSVLTVDQNGLITAVGPGTADITATAGLQSASVTITVVTGWTSKAAMPTPRTELAVAANNGILYAIGGYIFPPGGSASTVEAYDPTTDSWSTRAPMPTPRSQPGVGVINGIMYVVGGFDGMNALGTVEAYDPKTNSWTTKADMPTPRSGFAVGVIKGILYAVGGNDPNFFSLGTVEAYDPLTDRWSKKAELLAPRSTPSTGVINEVLYAAGGFNSTLGVLGTVEAYDHNTDSWSTRATAPTRRAGGTGGVINGILYVVGGTDPSLTRIGPVEAYDPATDSWSTRPAIPTPRYYLSGDVINGVLYVAGGNVGDGPLDIVEAYEP